MVPSKVIHIREARRRVTKARKKRVAPRRPGIGQRITEWLTSTTTKGTILMAGVVAGLVMGAVVASVVSVPSSPHLDPTSQVGDSQP